MDLYAIEVKICGTAYVKANSKEEAMAKLKAAEGNEGRWDIDLECNVGLFSPGEISFSPAATCYGLWDETVEADLVDECKETNLILGRNLGETYDKL